MGTWSLWVGGAIYPPSRVGGERARGGALEERVRRLTQRDGITEEKARHRVQQMMPSGRRSSGRSRARGELPEGYDLVVNTGKSSIEAAAELVLAKLQGKLHVACATIPCSP